MDLWYQVNREFPGYTLHIVPFDDNHQSILTELSALGDKYAFLVAACDSADWLKLCNFYELGDSLKLPFLRIFHFDDYANLLILNPNENIAVSISGLFIGF